MKSKAAFLFILLFLLICLVPSAGMLFFGPSGALANEIPARTPEPVQEGKPNMAYLTELTDYVSDTFFLRRELITGYAGLKALFGQSADEDVVTGRDGWLFYGDEMADYAGSEPLTEREVFAAANNLSLMQEYAEGEGAEFLFFIAPNKSSLYPEYLQGYPAAQTERNAERLMKELTERQVAYTNLSEAFLAEETLLYFAHDSHWTSRGAALAADQALAAVGRESAYFDGDFSGAEPHTGDLYEMLFPAAADPETDTPPAGLEFQEPEGMRPDSITIETTGGESGSLLMFRDSFGELLYPYLADSFERAHFSRQSAYDLTKIGATQADVVMIELVERNIRWLMEQPAVFPAPEREEGIPDAAEGEAFVSPAGSGAPEGYIRVEGETAAQPDPDSPVYLQLDGGRMYEAWISGERTFTACLPEAEACTVFWRENGGWMRCEAGISEIGLP